MAIQSSRRLTRRTFLKSTALAAGAAAVAGSAGCSSVDTSGEKTGTEQAMPSEETFINVCRGNCGNTCPLEGKVRDGKLVSASAVVFPKEAEGMQLGCVKGQTTPLRVYATNRVMHPMRQTGARGSDDWEQITWEEAFELVAEKFSAAQKEYGDSSVAFWLGAGNVYGYLNGNYTYFDNNNRVPNTGIALERFLGKTGATVLSSSHDIAQLYFQGTILQAPFSSNEDFQNSKTIIMWGENPGDGMLGHWPWIVKAKENGARLITVDPQFSKVAARSDEWIPVRPGTDGALMLAVANYIIENGLVDEDYLRNKSVAPLLIKEDGKYVRLSEVGLALDKGEKGEVDSPVVWDEEAGAFASMLTAKKAALQGARDANGVSVRTVYDATLESIAPFTVEFAAEECGLPTSQIEGLAQVYATNKPSYIINAWGMEHFYNSWRIYYGLALLASLTGNAAVSGAGYNSGFSALASTYLKMPVKTDWSELSIKNPKPNKVITGERIYEITQSGMWAGEEFPLRCVYMMTSNPLHSNMGVTYIKEAFDKIDFLVTADTWMTDSAQYSDLVLPVALSWEMQDFNGTFMCQKAIEPVGECKSDFEILGGIAAAMGYDDLYDKSAEEYLRGILDTPENLEAGVAYDDWMSEPLKQGKYAYAESVTPEYNALGRTQFYLETVPPRDNYGQDIPFNYHLPFYEHAYEAYPSNPLVEQYPLYGLSYHNNYHAQSMFAHNPWLDEMRGHEGKPYCFLHETAAAERGIKTGDPVKVYNDHGHCVLTCVLTKGQREDVVLMPHGWQGDEFIAGHPQSLTSMCPDPITSNNNLNDWLCQVEKYEGGN